MTLLYVKRQCHNMSKTSLPDSCVANPGTHAMGIGNLFQRPTGKIQIAFNNTLCDNGFNLQGAT